VGVRVVVDRVDLDPVLRAAVAGLAADAVGELELLAAPLLGTLSAWQSRQTLALWASFRPRLRAMRLERSFERTA
jgi:hypothetical protein